MIPGVPQIVGITLSRFVGQDLTVEFSDLESQFIDLLDGLLQASIDFMTQSFKTPMKLPKPSCQDISYFTQLGSCGVRFRLTGQLAPCIPIIVHGLVQPIAF
ncbi:MAG TPA: hypothetical protein DIT94_11445 [Deltaproteobacteria bacterium]|nr:hypothetical protein [Deltaproteobacteria bacterium]